MLMEKEVWADCPICRKRIVVGVDEDKIKSATSYPVSIVNVHGTPSHLLVFYVDADYHVRGVESHETLVTEELQDQLAVTLKTLKSKDKIIEMPILVQGLEKIRGVEYADSKGIGIVALKEAGPTLDNIISPSGRIKGRFIVDSDETIGSLEPLLLTSFASLEETEPLTRATFQIYLKILDEAMENNESISPGIFTALAESEQIAPKIMVKTVMFDAMKRYSLPDDFAQGELAAVEDKLDGYFMLSEILEIIEEKGLSQFRLLKALEMLRDGEAIIYKKRARAMWGPLR
jgi:hypothetical protein